MNIQSQPAHNSPFVGNEQERGGTHDKDGFVLSAHPGKSQGRPRTTSSAQLISQIGLPDRVSQQQPQHPEARCSRRGRTAFSCPDNGSAYRSTIHALACRTLGIRHLRTRPYRPRTNGKAERFIRTMLGAWAYGAIYGTSAERTAALPGWLEFYNWRRPHGSLSKRPPGTRLHELNNVTRSYI
jgi:Integrase core domain